jgi:EmrB/QacA subfamily drug resistance transporter
MSRWTLSLTSLAFFMVALDALAVVTALPAIHRDLGASLGTLQWTINAYTLSWAAAITTAAALGDRYGRRRVFALGLVLFSLASAACALSPSAEALIAARVIQGIGAGVIMPLSLTILTGAFPPERRGAMVGLWGCIAGIAVIAGPLMGGAVTQGLSWQWIFWANVPIGLVAAVLSLSRLPESVGPATRLDPVAAVLVTGAAIGIVLGLMQATDQGWTSPVAVIPLVLGACLMAAFIVWETRVEQPMVPMTLFRNATFSAANATSFFMSGAQYAAAFLVAQYFQVAQGHSPFDTGLRLLPWTATPLVVAPLAGALSDRVGRRPLLVAGMICQGAGFAGFGLLSGAPVEYWQSILPLAVAGIGVSMVIPVAPAAVIGAVEQTEMGKASAVNSMLQRFGSALGVAVAAAVFAANGSLESPDSFVAGFRLALLAVSGLAALGALTAFAVAERTSAAAATERALHLELAGAH